MIPSFCSPSFMNRTDETLHMEEQRVTELQANIHKKMDELSTEKFQKVDLTYNGKDLTRIQIPIDIRSFVEAYSIIKKLSHTLTDKRLRQLLSMFYDCEFCLSQNQDNLDCYELRALFFGIHSYGIAIDGYSDEIVELVSLFNENVLKTEKNEGLDFSSLDGVD